MRFITPAGRAADAAYAAASTGAIVRQLEAYFDQPHPYAKLDSLAVPVTVGFASWPSTMAIGPYTTSAPT